MSISRNYQSQEMIPGELATWSYIFENKIVFIPANQLILRNNEIQSKILVSAITGEFLVSKDIKHDAALNLYYYIENNTVFLAVTNICYKTLKASNGEYRANFLAEQSKLHEKLIKNLNKELEKLNSFGAATITNTRSTDTRPNSAKALQFFTVNAVKEKNEVTFVASKVKNNQPTLQNNSSSLDLSKKRHNYSLPELSSTLDFSNKRQKGISNDEVTNSEFNNIKIFNTREIEILNQVNQLEKLLDTNQIVPDDAPDYSGNFFNDISAPGARKC